MQNNLTTTTATGTGSASNTSGKGKTARASQTQVSITQIDRIAGLYVTGSDGQPGILVASAGRDINSTAAIISNTSSASNERTTQDGTEANSTNTTQRSITQLSAGRDINLGTVSTGISLQGTSSGKKASSSIDYQDKKETGSAIEAKGDISLQAGQNINARAATIQSQSGSLALQAGNDINIEEGRRTFSFKSSSEASGKGALGGGSSKLANSTTASQAIGSALGANAISLDAGRDITVKASQVRTTDNKEANLIQISAGRNLFITDATNTAQSNSHMKSS